MIINRSDILQHDIQNLVISYKNALKSALTFFTPYSSSVGGFNTTSIVPYISIPLSFGNTRLSEPLVKCIYLRSVGKSGKILFSAIAGFFTPYGSSVGGFNTTPIVPYIAIRGGHQ